MRATNSSKDTADPYADLKANISSLKAEKQQMQVSAHTWKQHGMLGMCRARRTQQQDVLSADTVLIHFSEHAAGPAH
jgi:hypothetical protein